MILEMDEDLKTIAEFMQSDIPAEKLVGVAAAMSALAPSLWGHYGQDGIIAIRLLSDTICVRNHDDDQHTQLAAI
jgi:hypothetical protein